MIDLLDPNSCLPELKHFANHVALSSTGILLLLSAAVSLIMQLISYVCLCVIKFCMQDISEIFDRSSEIYSRHFLHTTLEMINLWCRSN